MSSAERDLKLGSGWPTQFRASWVFPLLMVVPFSLVAGFVCWSLWVYFSAFGVLRSADMPMLVASGSLLLFSTVVAAVGLAALLSAHRPMVSLHREGIFVRGFAGAGGTAVPWDELELADYGQGLIERHLLIYLTPEAADRRLTSTSAKLARRVSRALGGDSDLWIPQVWLRDHPGTIIDVLQHFAADEQHRQRLPSWSG